MSLKSKILYYLEKNGRMTLQELESLCKSEQKKLSNGERRLREIMATNSFVKPETNSRGAIIAYHIERLDIKKWNEQFYPVKEEQKNKQLTLL